MDKILTTEQAILKTMETPEGRENAFLCYYEWDVTSAYQRFLLSEEWLAVKDLLSKYQPPSRIALDLGAGNGIGSFALSQAGYTVIALEPDPSELVGYGAIQKFNKGNGNRITTVSGFGEKMPFEDASFGLVYVRQALHHASDLKQMLGEISRILQPGGILVATREHVIDNPDSLKIFLEHHDLHKYTNAESAYTLDEYQTAIKNANLKLEKLLLSKDSVINHYPTTDKMIFDKFNHYLRSRFGKVGILFSKNKQLERLYRSWLSKRDHQPGRMISFVARTNK